MALFFELPEKKSNIAGGCLLFVSLDILTQHWANTERGFALAAVCNIYFLSCANTCDTSHLPADNGLIPGKLFFPEI